MAFSMAIPAAAFAGGDAPIEPAPEYERYIQQISIREGEILWEQGVPFFDCNTMEEWATGFIPGATFFNVGDWKKLLPADKNATMVFYCVNRLCTASEVAVNEVMKLGYKNALQMPEGIWGWRLSGRKTERP